MDLLTISKLSDPYADTEVEVDGVRGCMRALTNLKQRYSHLKVILSIGGGGQGSAHFPIIASSNIARQVFSSNVKELVDMYGFDGVDSQSQKIIHLTFTDTW